MFGLSMDLKMGSYFPPPPNRLISCTNVEDDAVLNLGYMKGRRVYQLVCVKHTNAWILKRGSKLPPPPESSDFVHKCSR